LIYDEIVRNRFPVVGFIGAGSLARLHLAPAIALGVGLKVLAESKDDSAAQVCQYILGDCNNLSHVLDFASQCDLLTYEDGHIGLSIIKGLEAAGIRVYPRHSTLNHTGDKEQLARLLNELSPSPHHSGSEPNFAVTVARSAHGQACTWSPTEVMIRDGNVIGTITPATSITPEISQIAAELALTVADRVGLVGVMTVEMTCKNGELSISELVMQPGFHGHWSIEGSLTSVYEQHLRAILDLPLGDPSMTAPFAVMGTVIGGQKRDMYRPYLHLMARNPELKVHQYMNEVAPGETVGHVTAAGDDLEHLKEIIDHARGYMSGEIDE
jgi:5-(carboxyamino)imidazole ribonucleotide synthase